MTDGEMLFESREAFRAWLMAHADAQGTWLILGKKGGPATLTAAHALEEALCFGWVDGQMESLDETRYRKYFAPRRAGSSWSEKNRMLAQQLEADGKMTDRGRAAIAAAKQGGAWEGPKRFVPSPEDIQALAERLRPHGQAYDNFMRMTPSVQRTYTGFCMDAKTEEAGARRFAQLVQRLALNLNPMESLKKKQAELER